MLRSQLPLYPPPLINMTKKTRLKKVKDWFKLKKYPHIGFPLKPNDRSNWVEEYVLNAKKIAEHSFLPFIHHKKKVRKFRKEYCEKTGKVLSKILDGKKQFRYKSKPKERELYYASHLDALVYSYYAEILSKKYDVLLGSMGLDDVVTAYRKIPVSPLSDKNKCNIDFAVDIFKFILNYPDDEFVVLAFDIKGFFDNLNHAKLRDKWKDVLGSPSEPLPDNHFNVFKNITRYSYVDLVGVFKEFQNQIFVNATFEKKSVIKRKRVSKIKYLKKSNAVAFCTKKEFLNVKNKLIKKARFVKDEFGITATKDFGIPQGSPISAILANLYMLDFDANIFNYLNDFKGVYRRYSDDMIVVCPLKMKDAVIDKFNSEISNVSLSIQEKKTQIFHFKRKDNILTCGQEFPAGINWNKNLIYLGLEFDGLSAKIKSASISGYYRKMKRTVKRAKHFSNIHSRKYSGELFKARLLKKFTHVGSERRLKYIWNASKNHFEISNHFDWGNFISYTKKASKIKLPNAIHSQTKRHWNTLHKLLGS